MLMAAITLTVLLGLAGLAIDSGRAMLERERMQAAADLSVLAATITYNQEIKNGKIPPDAFNAAIQTADRYYQANTNNKISMAVTKVVKFGLVNNGAGQIPGFGATVNADVNTTFGRIIK